MVDNSQLAVGLSRENAVLNGVPGVLVCQSDGFSQLSETGFTKILSNPPYHSDFSAAKHFINRLPLGGEMYMVVKRKEWYKNRMISIFGGVTIQEIDGYHVLCAEKRSFSTHKKGSEIDDNRFRTDYDFHCSLCAGSPAILRSTWARKSLCPPGLRRGDEEQGVGLSSGWSLKSVHLASLLQKDVKLAIGALAGQLDLIVAGGHLIADSVFAVHQGPENSRSCPRNQRLKSPGEQRCR